MSKRPFHRPIDRSSEPKLALSALVRLLARQAARSSLNDHQSKSLPSPDTEINKPDREE
jgi:hypothetical protein